MIPEETIYLPPYGRDGMEVAPRRRHQRRMPIEVGNKFS
jgi:hypothetical protein